MLYQDVSWATSPQVTRPRLRERIGICIHETIGFDSLTWLQGRSAIGGHPASSDFLISRHGTIYQITKPDYYAFHTGVAQIHGFQELDKSLNQSLIGVELENNPDRRQRLTSEQYIACAWLIRQLVAFHHLDIRAIYGHKDIALPPGRKSDPATMNWGMLTGEILWPSKEAAEFVNPGVFP